VDAVACFLQLLGVPVEERVSEAHLDNRRR
jgi:hypothetical protein